MIVAVSAAPVYDKTAVVARLAAEHDLQVVHDPAPQLCERHGFQTLYEMPVELQRACRVQLLEDHLDFVRSNDDVVFDHSVIEWLADWMRWFWSATPTAAWAETLELGREAAARYGELYHLSGGPPRPYDGYAWLDAGNARQVDALMRFLYRELGVHGAVRVEANGSAAG